MFAIPDEFEWHEPWQPVTADYEPWPFPQQQGRTPFEILNNELHREMPIGHALYGLDTVFIAVCTWTHKDFIVATNAPDKPIALVHLTWSEETDPIWPRTTVFRRVEDWCAEMKEWAAEWQQVKAKKQLPP